MSVIAHKLVKSTVFVRSIWGFNMQKVDLHFPSIQAYKNLEVCIRTFQNKSASFLSAWIELIHMCCMLFENLGVLEIN